ncbi:MAG: S9 family peptidase [Tenuifilaceae bacterium]
MRKLIALCLFLIAGSNTFSQVDEGLLTIDRIFNSSEFRGQRPSSLDWLPDGSGYISQDPSTTVKGGVDLVKYDPKTGSKVVLLPAENLIPAGSKEPLPIEGYTWSSDNSKLLIFTNGKQVWRYNTRGDYWVLNLTDKKLFQIGKNFPESSLMFAKISPDGTRAAYVSGHNIYVEDLSTNEVKALTTNGSKTLINGTFDWVYEEEFDCRDGFRWSPDSKRIAYWQLDATGVRDFYMINNTDSLYSFIIPVQYPKAGEKLSSCRVGVISANGGETVWVKFEGDPRNNYIPRMDWAESSNELLIQYIGRRQNKNQVFLANATTGDLNNILTETDEAWLDPIDDLKWLDSGKSFTWVSERTGWKHIYIVSRDGKVIKPVTSGNFDVVEIKLIDDTKGYIYYTASPENPTQRYLWRTKLNGKGKPERLTTANYAGTNTYSISPNAAWAVHSFSNVETPSESYFISLPDHKVIKQTVDSQKLKEVYAKLKKQPVEFFKVTIDENVEIDGFMIKPYNFDPTKKYPVLFFVYGEPAGTTVNDRWGGTQYLWHLMLAQKGYIVVSFDNRGTPSPKGREFRKSIYLKMGVLNSSDQAKAAVEFGKKYNFIDTNRYAIWGWSGGGSSTLNALFRYPEIYKTGMSVAPVADIHLYDAIYQERYMNTPQNEPQAYIDGSPVTFAKNLKGNLLVVHGTGDDNVHYQGTERLINELVKHNKHFTMLAYPNRSHGIWEGKGTTLHLYNALTKYLLENLEAGGK